MPSTIDYFLALRPAAPWSAYPFGLPALGLVAFALIAITVWTYLKHPAATRRRISIVLALRLLALVVALLTALRPSLGIQEDPKVPSTLLLGVDLSESMTIRDEFNNQTRIDAVRKTLEKCEPTLEALRTEQNVNVVMYAFGKPDFDLSGAYDPAQPAAFKRSDYGAYLSRTFEKWQSERFIRAHVVIGDGADNGTGLAAASEAARWRAAAPLHTFSVGRRDTRAEGKDVAIVAASADPSPVPIKNDVTIKAIVHAFGFSGAKVPFIVSFDDKPVAREMVTLAKEANNEINISVKAPDKPGEIKVRLEIPVDSVPGDANPANNVLETYLTVSREGVRVLLIDRDRFEHTFARDALAAEKRFNVVDMVRQRDDPATPQDQALLDFDTKAYDVIVIGNISAKQMLAINPQLPEKIRDQVLKKGAGLLMTGGDASFAGTAGRPLDGGWVGTALETILPVSLTKFPRGSENLGGEERKFQTVPTIDGLDYLLKVAATADASREQWDKLNAVQPYCRLTAIARLGEPKPGARVFAVASDSRVAVPAGQRVDKVGPPYLLVGWQLDSGNKGRVLAFGGYDTYLWKPFGLRNKPRTRDGLEMHAQFWRRMALWLAHQDEADGAAFARPEFRRLPVRGKQAVNIGLVTPERVDALDPVFTVKIVGPGEKPEEAPARPVLVEAAGRKVLFDPTVPGEYTVMLTATGKDAAGKEVKGDATARFLAYPEASDELLRAAADPEYLETLARAGGGRGHALEDLPAFLTELKSQPLDTVKPKPRFLPDWRRDHSHGFLPGWLVLFAILLGLEWGLRRVWGMA